MPLHTSGRPPSRHVPPAPLLVAGLRELLQQHRSARLDQIEAFRLAPPGDEPEGGPLLQAAARAAAAVCEIEAALQRLEDGTYGGCTSCGARVESSRLAAVPWAGQCAACADAGLALG